MDDSVFYNRVKETEQITAYVGSQDEKKNKIILLEGNTGVGKSGLVRKILHHELKDRSSIVVSVIRSSPDTIENLYYINAIYRRLSELAKEQFFDKALTPCQQGLFSIKNLFRFIFGVFWSRTGGGENRLYEPVEELSILRKKNYIISLLRKRRYIVDIENIQNIDTQSLEILKDILSQLEGTIFILEYTISDSHTYNHFSSFYNEISTFNAQIFPYKIKMLDFSEAKRLAPAGIPEPQLKSIYKQSEGNLIKVKLSGSAVDENDDPIQAQLSTLSKDERFLVNLVYLNGQKTDISFLFHLLVGNLEAPPFSQSTIESTLCHLANKNVIQPCEDGTVKIFHDSIRSELDQQEANSILYVAFNILKSYYCKELEANQNEYIVEQLFRLCIKFSDDAIISIFPYVKRFVRIYKYPRPIVNKLIYYREELARKGIVSYANVCEISLLLTVLCLELGLDEEAQKNLGLIYSDQNPYHRALQAAIYTLNFTCDLSMEKAEVFARRAQTPRERLTIELCLLSGKMARLPTEHSARIAKSLLDEKDYKGLLEYAFLLRNYAELVQDYSESITLYTKAMHCFREYGRADLCAQVYVSMSMFYAYKGELKVARKMLLKAEKEGEIPEYFILNNLAVLDLLEQKETDKTVHDLNDALLISLDPYERIIIMCNLLVCYTRLRECDRAKQTLEEIEHSEYTKFKYEEFLHIVYQDMYYYHSVMGDSEQAKKFRDCLIKLIAKTPGTMAHRIAKLQLDGKCSASEFYSNFPFRVDFLGNWNIEISRELERC